MEVRCPQCHTPIDPGNESLLSELVCVGCGGTFSLVGDEKATAPRGVRTLGRFELLERIGVGSFGAVWRARDTERDQIVAIKIPRKGDLDSEEGAQFLQEAEATAQLRHGNIVRVYEVGREGDTVYIVNEYIEGATLEERLAECRFTPQEAVDMCIQIADGLEHAHNAGIIHQDLKPGNILVDMDGVPHIADFGLARREAGEVTMTLEGRVLGTPAYASPEQLRDDAEPTDRRSDIYSLGVVLFELLTCERPFRGNVQMIVQQVIQQDAPSLRSFNGNVPRDLETICLKCLEKSPGRRYQAVETLRDDLQRYLEEEPIHARPIGSVERGRRWVCRHPAVSLLALCVVLLAFTVVAAITSRWYAIVKVQRQHARTQVNSVLSAEPQVVASVIASLERFREWADPILHGLLVHEELSNKLRYRVNLALLPVEPQRAEYVFHQLLEMEQGPPLALAEVVYGARALQAHRRRVEQPLWSVLDDSARPEVLRFRAALILVQLHAGSPADEFMSRLEPLAGFVTDELVRTSATAPGDFSLLVDAMRPIGTLLVPWLERDAADEQIPESHQLAAASFLGEYIGSDFDRLASVALRLEGDRYERLLPFLKSNREELRKRLLPLVQGPHVPAEQDLDGAASERRARAIVTLMHLDCFEEKVWPLLESSEDDRLRTALIQSFVELRLPPECLAKHVREGLDAPHENAGTLQALLLTLAEYGPLAPSIEQTLVPLLTDAYRTHPDSGVHSAIRLLLRRWGHADVLEAITTELMQVSDVSTQWYVNRERITMAVIQDPPAFRMGSPEAEFGRAWEERLHWRKIDRTFAVSTTEITVNQFLRYANSDPDCDFVHRAEYGPEPDGPALPVTWTQAAKYCRWLSEVEEIPEDQMCFPKVSDITGDMTLPVDYLERTGYRLPTEGEWEYACRAGTVTSRFYGESDGLVGEYGWYIENCHDRTWPVGSLRPNRLGLFDVYGNVWEWCTDYYGKLPTNSLESPFLDVPKTEKSKGYILRGGSITNRAWTLRSAQRDVALYYHNRNHNIGFRVARTMPSRKTHEPDR